MKPFYLCLLGLGILLCNGSSAHCQNQVSSDGNLIVTYEVVDGNADLYLWDIRSQSKTRLTDHPDSDYNPQWLESGHSIIFYRKKKDENISNIYTLDVQSLKTQQLTYTTHYTSDPSWGSNGSAFTFISNADGDHEIYAKISLAADVRQLTHNDSHDWSPNWSPTENTIIYVSNRTGNFELFEYDLTNNSEKQLTAMEGESYKPDFSPDGRHIAFFHRSSTTSKFDVYIVEKDGQGLRNMTNTSDSDEFTCGWSPDSQAVIYYCAEGLCSLTIADLERIVLWSVPN